MLRMISSSERSFLKTYLIPVLFTILTMTMSSCGTDVKVDLKNADTSAPTVPAGLTAVAASSSSIALNWNISTDDVAVVGYKIFRGGIHIATSATNAYTDPGLTAGTNYTYNVAAYDAAGNTSALSSSASTTTLAAGVTDTTAPTTPANLTATAVTATQINLSWTASTDNIGVAGYEVWQGATNIATVTSTSFSDTGLTANTSYTYTVMAYDAAGNTSGPSTSATAMTLAAAPVAPTAPANLSATAHDGYVTLSWDVVSGATTYNIYWSTTSGVTKTVGSKITGVFSSQKHSGLVNNTAYYYVVTAVNAYGESVESSEATVTPVNGTNAADPLYGDQWHLKNIGQLGADSVAAKVGEDINVEPAWTFCGTGNTCRGEGVRIAVVDDGLEIAHEDLFANIATGLSYNYVTYSSDPTNDPTDTTSGHGTAVAGIVAARDMNGLGGRGVAPRANLVGYNLLQNSDISNDADAMIRDASNVFVNTNSWGAPDGNGNLWPSNLAWQSAIKTGLTTGRGGRGIVYTWAAGNGAAGSNSCPTCVDNSNYDGQANFRGVMAVGAVNDQGTKSSYAERGANLWVSAPGGEFCDTHTITTTDRTGAVGENPNTIYAGLDYPNLSYTRCMNGTSSATPMVAGVAALVLQANPNLGWRDVRVILAETARKNDPTNTEWSVNGVGLHFNPNYGFGVVDANAAVTLAKTWTNNLATEKTYTTPLSSPNLAIPDNNATGVSNTIMVSSSGLTQIEFVEITFSAADHPYSGDLDITLTSPFGTVSRLAETHSCVSSSCTPYNGWVFGSANFLGEAANGTWTLTVKDLSASDTGTFQSWGLKFYGI